MIVGYKPLNRHCNGPKIKKKRFLRKFENPKNPYGFCCVWSFLGD